MFKVYIQPFRYDRPRSKILISHPLHLGSGLHSTAILPSILVSGSLWSWSFGSLSALSRWPCFLALSSTSRKLYPADSKSYHATPIRLNVKNIPDFTYESDLHEFLMPRFKAPNSRQIAGIPTWTLGSANQWFMRSWCRALPVATIGHPPWINPNKLRRYGDSHAQITESPAC